MGTVVKPRLLDLFCGAGGCTKGYQRAGFEVVGVDLNPQPFYCGDHFVQMDAIEFLSRLLAGEEVAGWRLEDFVAVHASPPCQRYSEGGRRYPEKQAQHPDLLPPTRDLCIESGLPYVIENVVGARWHMKAPVMICGRSLGLPRLPRHRLFETNFTLLVPECACAGADPRSTIGVYGDRPDGRQLNSRYPGARAAKGLEQAHEVMGMDWADWKGTKEAIPPVYTEHIGWQLLAYVQQGAIAA